MSDLQERVDDLERTVDDLLGELRIAERKLRGLMRVAGVEAVYDCAQCNPQIPRPTCHSCDGTGFTIKFTPGGTVVMD